MLQNGVGHTDCKTRIGMLIFSGWWGKAPASNDRGLFGFLIGTTAMCTRTSGNLKSLSSGDLKAFCVQSINGHALVLTIFRAVVPDLGYAYPWGYMPLHLGYGKHSAMVLD